MRQEKKFILSIPSIHAVLLREGRLSIVNEPEFRAIFDVLHKIGEVGEAWIEDGKILVKLVIDDEDALKKLKMLLDR